MRTAAGLRERLFVVEFAQRDIGDAHLVGIGAGDHAQPEDLKAVRRGHAIQLFIDGADQHLTPVAFDGAFGLALFAEPVEHGDAVEIGTRDGARAEWR